MPYGMNGVQEDREASGLCL